MIPVPHPILERLAGLAAAPHARLEPFGGGREDSDGVVYAFPEGGGRRLLKVLALPPDPSALGCLEERLRFVRFLAERGASVAAPLPAPDGALCHTLADGEHVWAAYRMDIAPGRIRAMDEWDEPFFRRWGRAVGAMHRLAQDYPAPQLPADPAADAPPMTWRSEWAWFDQACADEEVRARWLAVRRALDRLPCGRGAFGFVHNDPHLQNVIDDDARLTVLDFDVAGAHWYASDIAIACQSVLFAHAGGLERPLERPERLRRFLDCLLEGYAAEHALPPGALGALDLFIAYRRILLFVVLQGWLAGQPATRDSWRRMIVEQPALVGPLT